MRKFLKNDSGVGAVEFALIVPMLSLLFLGLISTWSYMTQNSNMRDAVEASAKYYIMGGTSDAKALQIAEATWSKKPTGGTVTVSRVCSCLGVNQSCAIGGVCSDNTVPRTSLIVLANSTWTDPYSSMIFPNGMALSESETIRVR